MFGHLIFLVLYMGPKSLFDCIIGLNSTAKKRLLIDSVMFRQSYKHRELNEVVLIASAQNPADPMTKKIYSGALHTFLDDSKANISSKVWIKRPTFAANKSEGFRKSYNLQ